MPHCARPTAQIATPPPGGKTGMAPLDSPRGPTEEMVNEPGGDGLLAFFLSAERWEVMLDRDVWGGRAGSDGVRRPNFGSGPTFSICTL